MPSPAPALTAAHVALLLLAGVLAGLAGTVAGLASIASYPALLAVGLPPLAANVSNTVALVFSGIGSAAGSRPELRGQGGRLLVWGAVAAVGGTCGAALLLVTPAEAFERVVPWLVAGGSLVLLARPRLRSLERDGAGGFGSASRSPGARPALLAGTFAVAVYAGYFGAAAGVLMLALLAAAVHETLARVNALKTAVTSLANLAAAAGFALFGPVEWAAVVPLAAGLLVGGWLGPAVVRRLPETVLRTGIALAGLALAVKLGVDAYRPPG
jgi:uncharacterized membrane protein YfcA